MHLKILILSLLVAVDLNQAFTLSTASRQLNSISAKSGSHSEASSPSSFSNGALKLKNDTTIPLPSSSYFIDQLFQNSDLITSEGKYYMVKKNKDVLVSYTFFGSF